LNAVIVGVKGQANSLASSLLDLDTSFELNGAQTVYLAAGDDVISQRLARKLEGVPFLAVQASYTSPLTVNADVVLPVENWVEQTGHYISMDGHVRTANAALPAPEGVWTNEKVLCELADLLGIRPEKKWKQLLQKQVSPVALIDN
jgi:NADH dehydrogenase/NADH:ubiquinone oxidoreductase subunit G